MVMTRNTPIVEPVGTINAGYAPYFPQPIPTFSVKTIIFPEETSIPGETNLTLKYALLAQVEINSDGFLIRCGDIDEEAYGITYEEAYFDFLTSIRDRYHSLYRREAHLSQHDRDILLRLRSLLE